METFELRDRGLVAVLDVAFEQLVGDLQLKIGDQVEVRNLEGQRLSSRIAGIEHADPWTPRRLFAFLLPTDVKKESVQVGAEVWKVG